MSRKGLYLYAHTVARMNPRQLAGVGERKLRELVVPRLPVDFDRRYDSRVPAQPSTRRALFRENSELLRGCLDGDTRDRHRERAQAAAAGRPSFLNRSLDIAAGSSVGWYDERLEGLPRLWRLKLYAFQPLSDVVRGYEPGDPGAEDCQQAFDGWLRDWMETVEVGGPNYLRRAWTPYAVSLRVQHWVRYLAWRETVPSESDSALEKALVRELYKNALYLRAHVEWGVGGNHLIENGAALVTAGVFLGDDGRAFIDTGTSILERTTAQFLDGGCHFERSPMYHILCLTRLLTVRHVLEQAGEPVPESVRATATDATGFLRFLRPPDDRIPLLNDAVYGQALPLPACLRYADAVGVATPSGRGRSGATSHHSETDSFHRLRTDTGEMLIDGGPVGPPHLPGHAHSDLLALLLWLDGARVVTDTGTFDYEGGERRAYARGVGGHNTVQVDDTEPVAVGGRFLMGPQPEPETRVESGDVSLFEGYYEAEPFEGEEYAHHRAVYAGDRWWLVRDTVYGVPGSCVTARLSLHPDLGVSVQSGTRVSLTGPAQAAVHAAGNTQLEVVSGRYFPRFGVEAERPVLELRAAGDSGRPVTAGHAITPPDTGLETVQTAADHTPDRCVVDDKEYQLPQPDLRPE